MQSRTKKIIVIVTIVVLALAIIIGAGDKIKNRKAQKLKTSLGLQLAATQTRTLTQIYQTMGTVRSNRVVDMKANIKGSIQEISVKSGDQVKKGQLLMRIQSSSTYNSYLQALNQYQLDQLSYQKAQRQFSQSQVLYRMKSISQDDYINAQQQLEQAKFQLQTSKESLENAKKLYADATVTSPIDGKVLSVGQSTGSDVNEGDSLFVVADMNQLKISATVDTAVVDQIQVGQAVQISPMVSFGQGQSPFYPPNENNTIAGNSKITSINLADSKNQNANGGSGSSSSGVTVETSYTPPNPSNVMLNTPVSMSILLQQKKDVPALPINAVWLLDDNQFYVFTKNGNKVEKVPVQLGINDGKYVEIVSPATPLSAVVIIQSLDQFETFYSKYMQATPPAAKSKNGF